MYGLIGGVSSMIGGGLSAAAGFSNLDYQKRLQRRIFDREDTSIQRRVADLKAAGLSPVLAAGQGAQAGQPISTQAPTFDTKGVSDAILARESIATSRTQRQMMQAQALKAAQDTLTSAASAQSILDENVRKAGIYDINMLVASRTGQPYGVYTGLTAKGNDILTGLSRAKNFIQQHVSKGSMDGLIKGDSLGSTSGYFLDSLAQNLSPRLYKLYKLLGK